MCKIQFRCETCEKTIEKIKLSNKKINLVLTSPPYNKSRSSNQSKKMKQMETYNAMYDGYDDAMNNNDYWKWQCDVINGIDDILIENGVILYNISYSNENPDCMWGLIEQIRNNTNFMIADCIIWKKKSALPQNVSPNKLTRLIEFVFVLCRKNEYKTYTANKEITSVNAKGQKYYANYFNFIEAANNDGANNLNKATFSSDMVLQLLKIYAKPNSVIYDPFMGTGTTGIGVERYGNGCVCIGSEISPAQVEYSYNRLNEYRTKNGPTLGL